MARYACLLVPDIAVAAALRAEPQLRGKPLAIVEPNGDGVILAGWMRGLSVTQARAVEPALEVRPLGIEGVQAARQVLCEVALSVGPRVMEAQSGLVFLDLDGLQALFPTERGLLTAFESRLGEGGLGATRLGIGPTRTSAELAALSRGGGHIVADGALSEFLAPLPLDLLDPPDSLAEPLGRWGIRTLGQLSRLDLAALGSRLGERGVELARRARGQDPTPFRTVRVPARFEEPAELDFAVDNLETLAFLLRGPLDRLTRRLRLRGLAARRLWMELSLQSGSTGAREFNLAAPTLEVAVLTSLMRLGLERDPPGEPVERIKLIATPDRVETAQLDLFSPPLPAPAELAMTVARIESLVGVDAVMTPAVRDSHLPDSPGTQVFRFTDDATARAPAVEAPTARVTMAQRALRPPLPVRVRGLARPEHVAPVAPRQAGFGGGRVMSRAGPWRLFGEWWGETRFARDYYDVELSDGGIYRLYHNLEDDSWYVDGIYD